MAPPRLKTMAVKIARRLVPQGTSALPAPAIAKGEKRARQIARESSEARHQRLFNTSESWTQMTAAKRQAVAG